MKTSPEYPEEGRCFICGDYLVPVREVEEFYAHERVVTNICERCDRVQRAGDAPIGKSEE